MFPNISVFGDVQDAIKNGFMPPGQMKMCDIPGGLEKYPAWKTAIEERDKLQWYFPEVTTGKSVNREKVRDQAWRLKVTEKHFGGDEK